MKRTLLLAVALFTAQLTLGQVAFTESFSTHTIGNVGTDLTGTVPGQGFWLTSATNGAEPTTTTNADNSNFQIVDAGPEQGNALQLTGPNGDKGNKIMTQAGLPAFWAARTPGNNILEIEYDFYTGGPTTSLNNMRMVIFDETGTKMLGGFSFAMGTKVLSGLSYYDATAQPGGVVGNYLFYLGGGSNNLVLPQNTWVRIGVSYNYTTGQVLWKGPGFNGNVPGAAPMHNPNVANIMATSGTTSLATNAAAATAMFDNIVVRASATDSLLGVDTVGAPVAAVTIFPNPANDVLHIANAVSLRSLEIVDLHGRVVKSHQYNGVTDTTVDVSELASGIYIVNLANDSGSQSHKIIKK